MQVLYQILPFVILIFIMYFMLIRPQKKKDKEIADMRSSLKIGDTIVTIGGLVGKIVKIKDDAVVIQAGPDRVKMEFMKWAVSAVIEKKVGSSEPASTSKRPKSLKKDENDKAVANEEAQKNEEKIDVNAEASNTEEN